MAGPDELEIIQEEYKHDVAVMRYWGGNVDSDSLPSGTPMVLTFGTALTKRAFYGYVNHPTRGNNSLAGMSLVERNSLTVTCVGASFQMKQTANTMWPSQTNSQIVQTIANFFGLSADIVPHATVWPPRPQLGMSYWQFCVALAKEIGYTFYCSGVQLVFKPRQTDPQNISGLVASYDYRSNPAALPVFSPTLGVTSPLGGKLTNRQLGGVDPRTLQSIYVQQSGSATPTIMGSVVNEPLFNESMHCVVQNQTEATSRVQGEGTLNQLYLTATATAGGNPLISQGSLIYVANANGSQNGLWWVEQAKHVQNKKTYTTYFCVGRDSLGAANSINAIPQTQTTPNGTLNNQIWVSMS
jgi:hypothetical protein